MKRILITSTDLMMIQFLVPHVRHLSENGFQVEIACSVVGDRIDDVRDALADSVAAIHTVRLARSPASPHNPEGYRDMKRLLTRRHYDIIWTNEPVMGVVTRLAARKARKAGTKVVYMCHGFHFYKGASKLNWLVFYPVERFMSRFCDMIVTINREDEARAKTFHTPQVEYIHGIGVNTSRLHPSNHSLDIRRELNLPQDAFLVLSVGELNENKNHRVLIQAMAQLKEDPAIHYCICGKGDLLDHLTALADELEISDRVHFLGYRTDVVDICVQADVFAHTSYREGLSIASLEAMYCGMPLVMSAVRGAEDYLEDGVSGFLLQADDANGFATAIRRLKKDKQLLERCAQHNRRAVNPYTIGQVTQEVAHLLSSLCAD